MKAKGYSGSRRFSARLKCTRPTERRRLSRLFRKSARETLSSESSIASASPISRQNRPRTSGRRYSPPVIGGASSMSAPSSLMAGGGEFPRLGRIERLALRAEFGHPARGEITPPRQRGRQGAPRLARAELQQPMARAPLEAAAHPLGERALEDEVVLARIEAERAVRREDGDEGEGHGLPADRGRPPSTEFVFAEA